VLSPIAWALVRADARSDALEAVEPLASALAEGSAGLFMKPFPRNMPDYARLEANVVALIREAEVTSSIEISRLDGTQAELDWYMEIRLRTTGQVAERRRGTVTIRVEKKKIQSINPVDFFAPAQIDRSK
jgi:hypothetical protein